MRITLIGAGAWGTALAIAFAGKHEVRLWSREKDVAVDLQNTRENLRFFPGYKLPESVEVFTDFAEAVAHAELLVVATPIAGLRPTAEQLKLLGSKMPVDLGVQGIRGRHRQTAASSGG
jgi:glycerol-3-phosphate dehydrogenase (NAD(P)+)